MTTENGETPLDKIDKHILQILQRDSSLTNVQLSEAIGLSPTPCLRRVRRLESEGYIRRYRAMADRKKLGFPMMAFVWIGLNRQIKSSLEQLEKAVMERPEIIGCYLLTGDRDYLLQIVTASLEDYGDFVRDYLTPIAAIKSVSTSFVLREIKKDEPIPV